MVWSDLLEVNASFCGERSHVVIHTPKRKPKEIDEDLAQKDLFIILPTNPFSGPTLWRAMFFFFFKNVVTTSGITYQVSIECDCGSIRSALKHRASSQSDSSWEGMSGVHIIRMHILRFTPHPSRTKPARKVSAIVRICM